MTSVTRNLAILVVFIIMVSYMGRAEAEVDSGRIFRKMFFQSQPDSSFIGFDDLVKCEIRNWTACSIG